MRALVVGSTHGNELTGAWLVRRLERHPELAARPGLAVEAVVGNPQAYHLTRRFVDADLNRQFAVADLANLSLAGYEHQRAKALNARYGPKARPAKAVDFVVDLHTTTTQMGITYMVETWSDLGLAAAAWCQQKLQPLCEAGELPPARIVLETFDREPCPYVTSLGRQGLTVEVGPVPQGVLLHEACHWTEAATLAVLDFLQVFRAGQLSLPRQVEAYRALPVKVAAPLQPDAKPAAIFHRSFQGRDFQPLAKGDAIFVDLDGAVICYDGAHGDLVWPIFVNEGGYYLPESGLGFGVTLKEAVQLPDVESLSRLGGMA